MTKTQHTPGQWHVIDDPSDSARYISAESGLIVARMRPTQARANAARIVACVNACEVIDDPESDIKEFIEAARSFFYSYHPAGDTGDAAIRMRAALALVGTE